MSHAKAIPVEPSEPDSGLTVPLSGTPVARPGFRRALLLLAALSIPLWAVILGGGFLIARVLG